jgi:hypothetical protein
MPRRRISAFGLLVAWLVVALGPIGARAATPVCSQFEVGSQKWQDCVTNAATGGSTDGKGNKGDTGAAVCTKFDVGSDKWTKCLQKSIKNGTAPSGTSACSGLDVGTDKWQQCIVNSFSGVVGNTGDSDTACSEFSVGSKEWTDCIEGAATGGGLMPWIIVIPLGVMVLGMMVMFARQARRSRNFDSFSGAQVGSTAGTWLIFVGFIEISMGVGSAVAESRADGSFGGYGIAAAVLLGVGVLLLMIGVVVTIKAHGKKQVEISGSPGRATVVRLSQTGTYINENPVFFFELDVSVPGIPQYRTTQRLTVPMYLVQGVGPGAVLPVKVDPSNPTELVVDWSGVSAVRTADPTGQVSSGTFPTTPAPTTFPGSTGAVQTPFPGSTGGPGGAFPGSPEQPG